MGRKPDFIGIGGQRCASTWVNRCLAEHPDIFALGIKGAHFFCRMKKNGTGPELDYFNYQRGIEWYESLFSKAGSHQIAGEGTPAYLMDARAPELIHRHYPDVKLIVSIRNPVERAYSHYKYLARQADLPETFEAALETPGPYRFIENGMFAQHLKRYMKVFNPEQILVLVYDEIKQNPQKVLSRLYAFVGANPEFRPEVRNKRVNKSDQIRSRRVAGLAHRLRYKLVTDWPFMIGFLQKSGLIRAGRMVTRLNTAESRIKHGPLQPDTRKHLIDVFRGDILELQDIVKRDFSHWLAEENT